MLQVFYSLLFFLNGYADFEKVSLPGRDSIITEKETKIDSLSKANIGTNSGVDYIKEIGYGTPVQKAIDYFFIGRIYDFEEIQAAPKD